MLFVYGLCNIGGSVLAGNLLTVRSMLVVKVFPVAVAVIYLVLLGGSADSLGAVLSAAHESAAGGVIIRRTAHCDIHRRLESDLSI